MWGRGWASATLAIVAPIRTLDGMLVRAATTADLPAIRAAYVQGREIQLRSGLGSWIVFSDAHITNEIEHELLYCAQDGDTFVGVFSIAWSDPLIWAERERGEHLYLHRISKAAGYARPGFFAAIVSWGESIARSKGLHGLRMDTWAINVPLVDYYKSFGFAHVETRRIPKDPRLSPHYHGIDLALLERPLTPHM